MDELVTVAEKAITDVYVGEPGRVGDIDEVIDALEYIKAWVETLLGIAYEEQGDVS